MHVGNRENTGVLGTNIITWLHFVQSVVVAFMMGTCRAMELKNSH